MIALKRNQDNNMMVHTGATSTQNVYFDKDYNLRDIDEKCSLKDLLRELSNPSRAKQEQTRNTQYSTNYPLGEEKNQNDVEKETKSSTALSPQELFLSVVLDWQKSHSLHNSYQQQDQKMEDSYMSSSSEYEVPTHLQRTRTNKEDDEISPTSVHKVPRELTPLNLDDSPVKKIGIYTPQARKELLCKYMAKRAKRLSQNKVRYRVRKTLANARPRVKGRFVKTEQPLTAAIVEAMTTTKLEEVTASVSLQSVVMVNSGDAQSGSESSACSGAEDSMSD